VQRIEDRARPVATTITTRSQLATPGARQGLLRGALGEWHPAWLASRWPSSSNPIHHADMQAGRAERGPPDADTL